MSDSQTCTLYEDWQARRASLAASAEVVAPVCRSEIRLLDFLLAHYQDSTHSARTARFPMRGQVYVDRRAIIVHRHLGKGYLSNVQTQRDAEEHVRKVLERMNSGDAADPNRPLFFPRFPAISNEPVEALRGCLCDRDTMSRMAAIVGLGQLGDLDDIGLLADLLALPKQSDEHPDERRAILQAMQRISMRFAPQRVAVTRPEDYWRCHRCGFEVVEYFDQCWKCGAVRG